MTSKECTVCHTTKPLDGFNKNRKSKDGHRVDCRECCSKYANAHKEHSSKLQKKRRASDPERLIRNDVLNQRRYRAKGKGMECNLTNEWRDDKLSTGKCERTGIPFVYEFNSPYIPSVDRIDSSKGYTTDNCQMVIALYNVGKNKWSDDLMLEMAKALIKESKKNGN
jgi:hypothetical protein